MEHGDVVAGQPGVKVVKFSYSCACGRCNGNGYVNEALSCFNCHTTATYSRCVSCDTRVDLDNCWKIADGTAQPDDYQLPVLLNLRYQLPGEATSHVEIELLHIPLLLGLRREGEEFISRLPDVLFLNRINPRDMGFDSQLITLKDQLRYDRRSSLCDILEAMLRRTLMGRGNRIVTEIILKENPVPWALEQTTS